LTLTDGSFRVFAHSALQAVDTALATIARLEPSVKAWAFLDPERARHDAAVIDQKERGPMSGLVAGVKDNFDTADQPTEYGSKIFSGHRPVADAAAVVLLRAGGAVCLGKTVCCELAYSNPGPTANPHRPSHTPGGSSMGSAAAVAAGMADFALGTQTAGSVLRPASYCGVYGFKPTFGSVSTAGVKPFAPSLDTVGWMARDPALLDLVRCQLTGRSPAPQVTEPPTIGLLRTEQWASCSLDAQRAVESAADIAQALGANVVQLDMPPALEGLADRHREVMAHEAAYALAWEHRARRADLSAELSDLLDFGQEVGPDEVDAVNAQRRAAQDACAQMFERCDAVLTPLVTGEAPVGHSSTGDSRFNRLWTLLGLPAAAVPATTGSTGLPVGVQLVGAAGADARLLAITSWLAGHKVVPAAGSGPAQGVLA